MNKRIRKKYTDIVKAEKPVKSGGMKAIALNSTTRTYNEKNGLRKPSSISFKVLRRIATVDAIIRICINVIKKTVSQSKWQVKVKDRFNKDKNAMNLYSNEINEVYDLFENMNDNEENMRMLLDRVIEDILTLDAAGIELIRSVDGKKIVGLNSVDGSCYSDDTEVLTRNGWKLFKDVNIDIDEFATRNKSTKNFEWQKATYYHEADWEGDFYHFTSRTLDVKVSPNHRMLVTCGSGNDIQKENIITAEEAHKRKHSYLPALSNWEGQYVETFTVEGSNHFNGKSYTYNINDFCAFMGMYLSEGCIDKRKNNNTYNKIYITQLEKSKGFIPFNDLLKKIVGKEVYHNGKSFEFKNRALYLYLEKFGQVLDKYIPDEILNLPKEQLQIFWDYYLLGDGWFGNNREGISTSSKRMADGLQEVVQKLGYSTSILIRKPKDCYIKGRLVKAENCHDSYIIRPRKARTQHYNSEKIYYKGKIYCVSVPNEILYVRRNLKPIWCGNTIRPVVDEYGNASGEFAYKQFIDDREVTSFTRDELVYIMANPQNSLEGYGFGTSPIESILLQVEASLEAESYNMKTFSSNNVPAGLLDLGDIGDEEAENVMATWNATVIGNTEAMKFMWGSGADRKFIPFQKSNKDMQFSQYIERLSRIKLAAYGLTAQDANIDVDLNRSTAEVHASMSNARGVRSMKRLIEEYFTRNIIRKMGDSEGFKRIEFAFVDIDTLADMELRAKTDKLNIENGVYSPKFVQERDGYPIETIKPKKTTKIPKKPIL